MTPRVVVLAPWRTDGAHRARLYSAVAPHVAALGWPVVEADSGHIPFSLANSWNVAAAAAGDWDVALLHEADYWVPLEQLRAAVQMVADGWPGQVYAYDRHVKMTRYATSRFMAGARGPWRPQDVRIGHHRVGGPRAVSRGLWDAVGGFDSRFVGWGYEDNAFQAACSKVHDHARIPGDLVNLWHERHDRSDPYYQAADQNRALLDTLLAP